VNKTLYKKKNKWDKDLLNFLPFVHGFIIEAKGDKKVKS